MRDFTGKELHVGDRVVYLKNTTTSSHYVNSRIVKITPKMVQMEDGIRKSPDKIVRQSDRDEIKSFIDEYIEMRIKTDDWCVHQEETRECDYGVNCSLKPSKYATCDECRTDYYNKLREDMQDRLL